MTKDKPEVRVRPATYQPSKAEIEADMSIDTTPEELARLCSVRSGNLASPRAGVYPGAGRSVILVIHESVQTNMENQYAERPG